MANPRKLVLTISLLLHLFESGFACTTDTVATTATKEWWETAAFYQIYPRSFKDSNGDGIGDLNGITEKLSYLSDIGVGATWLSPCFQSPMVDFGYDISDFYAIHNEYGTLDDFDALIARAAQVGVKIILDFVPNHTSDQHEWFQKSVRKEAGFENFYIWHPGRLGASNVRDPPSNWLSIFGGSAWTWNADRGEYYFHNFKTQQPDLNFRNPTVVEEMKNVLRFWLDRGVVGFRIDAIPHLFEAPPDSLNRYPDEPLSGTTTDSNSWNYLNHTQTRDLPETADMIYQWRAVLDEHRRTHGGEPRVMMLEAYSEINFLIDYFGNSTMEGAQMPFNFQLMSLTRESKASDYKTAIDYWIDNVPATRSANWVIGNHDNTRVGTRLGVERIDLINTLVQTLPGASVTYYGEEIGMTDVPIISAEDRDPVRTPFQWDASVSAGFSTTTDTWLPVSSNYTEVNVANQLTDTRSHLSCYMSLTDLRRTKTLRYGELESHVIGDVLVLIRFMKGESTYVSVANLGESYSTIDLQAVFAALPEQLEYELVCGSTFQTKGQKVRSNRVPVKANEAFVLSALPMQMRW